MKILISGATGFIGSNLVKELQPSHEIYALDIRNNPYEVHPAVHSIQLDLSQAVNREALPEKIDAVIHLAQSRYYRQFPEMAEDIYQVNVSSTFHLLEYARRAGARHFILASTGGVYQPSDELLTEDSPVQPGNFYATSKYTAELLANSYRAFFHTVIFRLFFVYGPGQKGMLVPSLLQKVMQGETIRIDGNPGLRINPTYVGDVVRAFEPALRLNEHVIINIAGDEEVSISGLVEQMQTASRRQVAIDFSSDLPGGRLAADNHRMKSLLNLQPRTSILEGLKMMLQSDYHDISAD